MKPLTKLASWFRSGLFFIAGKAPIRVVPKADVIVSSAHGRIVEIKIVEDSHIVFEKKGIRNHVLIPELAFPATLIAIEMTPLDIHVQRAPISGIVYRMDHYRGGHHSAMGDQMLEVVEENEKMVALFKSEKEAVAVIQVAGILARRIRNISEVGDEVEKGMIYGRIRFGSQVVVLVPNTRKVLVQVGDRTVDGETILAK